MQREEPDRCDRLHLEQEQARIGGWVDQERKR